VANKNTICVGAIMGAFGVKGEVRLKSFCAIPEDLDSYGTLSSEDGTQSYDVTITRPVKGGFAARIKDVRFKDQADKLRGVRLYVSRDALPNLPDENDAVPTVDLASGRIVADPPEGVMPEPKSKDE